MARYTQYRLAAFDGILPQPRHFRHRLEHGLGSHRGKISAVGWNIALALLLPANTSLWPDHSLSAFAAPKLPLAGLVVLVFSLR